MLDPASLSEKENITDDALYVADFSQEHEVSLDKPIESLNDRFKTQIHDYDENETPIDLENKEEKTFN